MRSYFDFWRYYAGFSGRTTRRSFWTAVIIHGLLTFFLLLFLGIILMMGDIAEIDTITMIVNSINRVISLLSIIPMIAMAVRRLRDAGYSAKSFLWLLIPVIGWIAFFVRLFGKTVTAIEPENVV